MIFVTTTPHFLTTPEQHNTSSSSQQQLQQSDVNNYSESRVLNLNNKINRGQEQEELQQLDNGGSCLQQTKKEIEEKMNLKIEPTAHHHVAVEKIQQQEEQQENATTTTTIEAGTPIIVSKDDPLVTPNLVLLGNNDCCSAQSQENVSLENNPEDWITHYRKKLKHIELSEEKLTEMNIGRNEDQQQNLLIFPKDEKQQQCSIRNEERHQAEDEQYQVNNNIISCKKQAAVNEYDGCIIKKSQSNINTRNNNNDDDDENDDVDHHHLSLFGMESNENVSTKNNLQLLNESEIPQVSICEDYNCCPDDDIIIQPKHSSGDTSSQTENAAFTKSNNISMLAGVSGSPLSSIAGNDELVILNDLNIDDFNHISPAARRSFSLEIIQQQQENSISLSGGNNTTTQKQQQHDPQVAVNYSLTSFNNKSNSNNTSSSAVIESHPASRNGSKLVNNFTYLLILYYLTSSLN